MAASSDPAEAAEGEPSHHAFARCQPGRAFPLASVGSNSNAAKRGLEAEKGRAAIWQVDRETGASRLFASRLRNPNGLTFHPGTRLLWTVVNERDELGPAAPPNPGAPAVGGQPAGATAAPAVPSAPPGPAAQAPSDSAPEPSQMEIAPAVLPEETVQESPAQLGQ